MQCEKDARTVVQFYILLLFRISSLRLIVRDRRNFFMVYHQGNDSSTRKLVL